MRVIFLDVDGVLNRAGCEVLLDGMYFVLDEKLKLLKSIIDATGAKVVLSSTWRYGWAYRDLNIKSGSYQVREIRHFNALEEKLKEFGIELLSRTPVLEDIKCCRGDEIDLWLEKWGGEEVESFVILDDIGGAELRPYQNRLIQTSFTEGLTRRHVDSAVNMLNKE